MSSAFSNGLNLGAALVASQVQRSMPHLKAAESQIPSSDHAHRGNDNVYLLSRENMNFQMFDSSNNITFITGHDDSAIFDGGGSQTIYDFGTGASLNFHGLLAAARVEIFNSDHDSRFQLYLHGFTDQSIIADGHGGTLVGGQIDIVNAAIPAAKVHFDNDPSFAKSPLTDMFPRPPHADY